MSMSSSKESTEQAQNRKDKHVASKEEEKIQKPSEYRNSSRGKSPSSVQEIQQQKPKQLSSSPASSSGSPNIHWTNKEHSSKKPPPPSHGSSFFDILPSSLAKFFGSGERASSEAKHHNERRHSEPNRAVIKEGNTSIGKSTSYPEQIPRVTPEASDKNSSKKEKEQTNIEAVSQEEEKTSNLENKKNEVEEEKMDSVPTKSGRPSRSNSLPPDSEPFFPPKPQSKGLTASRSIDEFLNKFTRPRGNSLTEERKSFELGHTGRHVSRSSSEHSSSTRSRSPSVISNLLNRSGSKESRFVVPATGARQLRPHEISRQKYLECLKKKLVPTEFVYTGEASEVLLMGDWLEWDSIPLNWEEEKGCFRVVVDLPVGEHEFRYIVTPKQGQSIEK